MTRSHPNRRAALLSLGGLALLSRAAAAAKLPGSSVFQLPATLTDQDGRAFELASLRGQVTLASMFYSSCDKVCPVIFETIAQTLKALPAAERERVKVLMVSFDPAHDSVAVLKKTFEAHGCDARWTLARTDEASARKIAAVLGVQYRRLADGEFNHSSVIELLDSEGRIAARSAQMGVVDAALKKALRQALAAGG